jgi:hypothetical protein
LVGSKREHIGVEGKSYIEGQRQSKELKHEVKFYRRVEMGCYGNEPNIHPGVGGRTQKKRGGQTKKKKKKKAESKTARSTEKFSASTGCTKSAGRTKVRDIRKVQDVRNYMIYEKYRMYEST